MKILLPSYILGHKCLEASSAKYNIKETWIKISIQFPSNSLQSENTDAGRSIEGQTSISQNTRHVRAAVKIESNLRARQ
jgi:hypothetical protein